mmetsp:Transcript_7182/g.10937  ORF Transcript_7182/g.10937 Transcript_7182/m.10937 type:complete len:95 (-) Transcript_7182:96-380(-)
MENPVNLALVQKLRMLCLDTFQFNGNFFSRGHVSAKVNVPKGPAADFTAEPIFLSDAQFHRDSAGVFSLGCVKRRRDDDASFSRRCSRVMMLLR